MIDLTPLDVRKKKDDFRRVLRGYDPQAVDDFLDLVADRLEQAVRDQLAGGDRLRRLEEETAEHREREQALTEALVTAQEMREDMRRQTTREGELIRREAESEAASIRAAAVRDREREEEVLRRLRARQRQLVESYRSFLERELSELSLVAQSLVIDPASAAGRRAAAAQGHDRGAAPAAPLEAPVSTHEGTTKPAEQPQAVRPLRELGPTPEAPAGPRSEPLFSILSEDDA
jgi:cell division initiation protein